MNNNRLYDTVRWRKAAKRYLNANPLCVMCLQMGRDTAATVVDHKQPHHGDYDLFWNEDNWQSLCATCHSAAKRMQEIYGYSQAADVNGFPIDKGHPFNKCEEKHGKKRIDNGGIGSLHRFKEN